MLIKKFIVHNLSTPYKHEFLESKKKDAHVMPGLTTKEMCNAMTAVTLCES